MRMGISALVVLAGVRSALAVCTVPPGDLDGNGLANVVDVQCGVLLALWALGGSTGPAPACASGGVGAGDPNCDGLQNVVDVQILVANALSAPLSALVDANGNGCVDDCELGPCCEPKSSPECESPACSACVCALDPFCCASAWDLLCVAAAGSDCAAATCPCAPPCPKGGCCAAGACPGCLDPDCEAAVCAISPACCANGWTAACAEIAAALCSSCDSEGSDCCTAHFGAGCAKAPCQACVCALDPFCCATTWDSICAAEAAIDCPSACACTAGAAGDCCVEHASPGCSVPSCASCVCALDVLCCSVTWDSICAAEAALDCAGAGCACDPPCAPGSCCLAGTCPGCIDPVCEAAVCGENPSCCGLVWSQACATAAKSKCSSCASPAGCCVAKLGPGCPIPACQTCVCALDTFCCDKAWDVICAAEAKEDCPSACGCM